jgi:membrane protease YdiL (CAAX protease family)
VVGVAAALWLAPLDPSGLLAANVGGVAAILFVLLPDARIRARGETWREYGLPWWGASDPRTWRAWGRGALRGLAVCAVVLPAFAVLFWAWQGFPVFTPRLPSRPALRVATQFLVIALPEELFYRGWMQTAWARRGAGRRVLGAEIGPGFLATQLLFAAGHLVTLQPWRLATFFPGLLFGWVRARTGNVVAPVVVHALSNLLLALLEASLPGSR